MAEINLVRWMLKNDHESYAFWKNTLRPALGRSIKRTDEAIRLLEIFRKSPFSSLNCKHSPIKRIARKMTKYQNLVGAGITFGFLHDLSKDHKQKILKQRNRKNRLSK